MSTSTDAAPLSAPVFVQVDTRTKAQWDAQAAARRQARQAEAGEGEGAAPRVPLAAIFREALEHAVAEECSTPLRRSAQSRAGVLGTTVEVSHELEGCVAALAERLDRPQNWVREAALAHYLNNVCGKITGIPRQDLPTPSPPAGAGQARSVTLWLRTDVHEAITARAQAEGRPRSKVARAALQHRFLTECTEPDQWCLSARGEEGVSLRVALDEVLAEKVAEACVRDDRTLSFVIARTISHYLGAPGEHIQACGVPAVTTPKVQGERLVGLGLDAEVYARLKARAGAAGLSEAQYCRRAFEDALGKRGKKFPAPTAVHRDVAKKLAVPVRRELYERMAGAAEKRSWSMRKWGSAAVELAATT